MDTIFARWWRTLERPQGTLGASTRSAQRTVAQFITDWRRSRMVRLTRALPPSWPDSVRQLHLWARGGQWLRYRNGRVAMANVLLRHGRPAEALEQLLDVWFVDLNGPRNAVPPREALLATEAPPLEPALGATQAHVRRQVRRLMAQLQLEVDDIQVLFFAMTSTTYRQYALPLAPSRAWLVVGAQLLAR